MDKIAISYQAGDRISSIFHSSGTQIQSEVLAEKIDSAELKGYRKEWNINGEPVILGVEKIN